MTRQYTAHHATGTMCVPASSELEARFIARETRLAGPSHCRLCPLGLWRFEREHHRKS